MTESREKLIFFLTGVVIGMLTMFVLLGAGFLAYRTLAGNPQALKSAVKKFVTMTAPVGKTASLTLAFENDQDVAFFNDVTGVDLTLSSEQKKDGKFALMAQFSSGEDYPGFSREVFKSAQAFNWEGKKVFSLDVYNIAPEAMPLTIKFKSGLTYPKSSYEEIVNIPAGAWKHIEVPISRLAQKINISAVSYLKFYLDKPSKEMTFFFDNLRVE